MEKLGLVEKNGVNNQKNYLFHLPAKVMSYMKKYPEMRQKCCFMSYLKMRDNHWLTYSRK
jgi:hypothetical protein